MITIWFGPQCYLISSVKAFVIHLACVAGQEPFPRVLSADRKDWYMFCMSPGTKGPDIQIPYESELKIISGVC